MVYIINQLKPMNNLLKTIKENDEEFENAVSESIWGDNNRKTLEQIMSDKGLTLWYDFIKSHITQSRIKELEALAENIKEMEKETYRPDLSNGSRQIRISENIGYNQALADIIQELKTIIKELKTNLKYMKKDKLKKEIREEFFKKWNASGLNDVEEFCSCSPFSGKECECKSRQDKFWDFIDHTIDRVREEEKKYVSGELKKISMKYGVFDDNGMTNAVDKLSQSLTLKDEE